MERPLFLAIFAAASMTAVVAACGSFGDATNTAGDGGTIDGAAGGDGGAPDSAVTESGPPPVRTLCTGPNLRLDESWSKGTVGGDWAQIGSSPAKIDMFGRPALSLFAETKEISTGTQTQAVRRTVDLQGDQGTCIEFDLRLEKQSNDSFTGEAYAEILEVRLPNEDAVLFVEMKPEGLSLTHNSKHAALASFVYGAWQHLAVTIPYGTNGAPWLEGDDGQKASTPDAMGNAPASLTLMFGIQATASSGTARALKAHIDNIRMVTGP